ncbi:MAG: molybdopterin-dependent oxidoreductase [Bryobacterales bacterium]|nr:molybdopterin-dependent oxidoreductase [Bryobacterales bacterium]
MSQPTSRRNWLRTGLAATAGAAGLAAAARLADRYGLVPPDGRSGLYAPGATLTYAAHRLLSGDAPAREFSRGQISTPHQNGPDSKDETLVRHRNEGFASWQLEIGGLVARPRSFTVAELRTLPSATQITQLVCEEGWSYIAEWQGVKLSDLLQLVGARPEARHVVYESMEKFWWSSLDRQDALHPQTIVAYGMNGRELPFGFGGPLRLRVPRQLGYQSIKYLHRLTVTDNVKSFGKGLGASSPEFGYAWYAGI